MLRVPRDKPANKKVSLQLQCLVSRLRSYPSCCYKMFFRYWSEWLWYSSDSHLHVFIQLHYTERKILVQLLRSCAKWILQMSKRKRFKLEQRGENGSRACGQIWLLGTKTAARFKAYEPLSTESCLVARVLMQHFQMPGLWQAAMLLRKNAHKYTYV